MKQKIAALCLLFTVFSALFLMIPSGAEQPVRYEAEEIYAMSSSSVFYLRNLGEYDTVRSVGTGVMISEDGQALTAYHVVKNTVRLEAVMQDGRTLSGIKVEAYDEKNDVALLSFPTAKEGERFSALPIRSEALKHGEQIFAIGYPLKETPIITQGIVNSPAAMINGRSRALTSAQIVSGMSGGPVVDEEGNVVGIISASIRTMPGIHSIITIEAGMALSGNSCPL